MPEPNYGDQRRWQEYLVERYSPYLEAVGIPVRGKTAFEVHEIAGRIISDAFLFSRAVEKHVQQPGGEYPEYPALLPSELRLQALQEFSPAEKSALRQRVTRG